MPKLNTTVKSVRIDNDVLGELERRLEGQTFNSWLNDRIEEFVENKEVVWVNPSSEDNINAELASMARCMTIPYDDLLNRLAEMMLSGEITADGGEIGVSMPYWAERFKETCHDKGLDVEKVAESAIKAVEKGLL